MARIRTIKPEFFDSPDTAQASYPARLLYIAMWCWADDYGVGTANGKALIGFAFPNDDEVTASEFPSLRKEVADSFGVHFYTVRGRDYYYIPSWDDHQRTERKSKRQHPAPPEDVSAGQRPSEGTSDDTQGTSVASHGGSGVGTGEQGNRGSNTCSSADASERPTDLHEQDFIDWYNRYPRKQGKGQARKAYRTARKKTDHTTLVQSLEGQSSELMRRGRDFCPLPATWLNGERWDDDTTQADTGPLRGPHVVNMDDPANWHVFDND